MVLQTIFEEINEDDEESAKDETGVDHGQQQRGNQQQQHGRKQHRVLFAGRRRGQKLGIGAAVGEEGVRGRGGGPAGWSMLETLDPNDGKEARRTNDEDLEKGRPFLSPSLPLTCTDTCSTSSSSASSSLSFSSAPLRAGIMTLTLGLFSLLLLLSSSLFVISEGQNGGRLRRAHVVPVLSRHDSSGSRLLLFFHFFFFLLSRLLSLLLRFLPRCLLPSQDSNGAKTTRN